MATTPQTERWFEVRGTLRKPVVYYAQFFADFEDCHIESDQRPNIVRPNSRLSLPELVEEGIVTFAHHCDHLNPDYCLNGPTINLLYRSLLREKILLYVPGYSNLQKWAVYRKALQQNDLQFDDSCPEDLKAHGERVKGYWAMKKKVCKFLDTRSGDLTERNEEYHQIDVDGLKAMARDGTTIEQQIILLARQNSEVAFSLDLILKIRTEEEDKEEWRQGIRDHYHSKYSKDLNDLEFEDYREKAGIPDYTPTDSAKFYNTHSSNDEGEAWMAERLNGSDAAEDWGQLMLDKYGKESHYYVEDIPKHPLSEDEEGIKLQEAITLAKDNDFSDLEHDEDVIDCFSEAGLLYYQRQNPQPEGLDNVFANLAHRPSKRKAVEEEDENVAVAKSGEKQELHGLTIRTRPHKQRKVVVHEGVGDGEEVVSGKKLASSKGLAGEPDAGGDSGKEDVEEAPKKKKQGRRVRGSGKGKQATKE